MELISVVVPVYNRAKVFQKSLESLVAQTYRPLQIIVVDDGSIEDVKLIFEEAKEKYSHNDCTFTYLRQENAGAPSARNRGLKEVQGRYVIFWDADVIGEPTMLQEMHQALVLNPHASFTYSNFLLGRKLFHGTPFSYERLKKENYITTTSLIRRLDVIQWDESLKRFQDWDLWLTLTTQGKTGVWINKILFHAEAGGTISSWLPSIFYHIPFRWLPRIHEQVKKYEVAKQIIFTKHRL